MKFDDVGGTLIDLTATAGGLATFVWHDIRPDDGGLGGSNNKDVRSTDNIFDGESVMLEFSEEVFFVSWLALNHGNGIGASKYTLTVDGTDEIIDAAVVDGDPADAVNLVSLSGKKFTFLNTSGVDDITEESLGLFYLSAVTFREVRVPEPGTLMLLGLGLLGFGVLGRRR